MADAFVLQSLGVIAADTQRFADELAERLFYRLNTTVEQDIKEILPFLEQHRPLVAESIRKYLYWTIMQGIYSARHQEMPPPEPELLKHVFGANYEDGCDLCRKETELMVAHQKTFF